MKKSNLTPQLIRKMLQENYSHLQKYRVKRIGLFGSYLKGTQTINSDLDFLIKLDPPTFDNYMGLKFHLEKLFKKKVDLITEESLKPALKHLKKEALYV